MPKYIRPVNGPVTDSFDAHRNRTPPSVNPGTDYAVPVGTPVLAPAGGRIGAVDDNPAGGGGLMIGLDTYDGDGFDFLHLDRILVTFGQYVNQGDRVALSGNTGNSTGPHLHLSFRRRQGSHFYNAGNEDFEAALISQASSGVTPISTIFEEDDMAINDGGYIAEQDANGKFIRGMIFGPGVPGGVIEKPASRIEELQAMGNLAGVRVFDSAGQGKRIGAPIKYVGTKEFDATRELAKVIYGQ